MYTSNVIEIIPVVMYLPISGTSFHDWLNHDNFALQTMQSVMPVYSLSSHRVYFCALHYSHHTFEQYSGALKRWQADCQVYLASVVNAESRFPSI